MGIEQPVPVLHLAPGTELGRATARGPQAEFAAHGWDADEIPDPQDPETFARSKLNWAEITEGEHARLLEVYRQLIALRRSEPDPSADPWLDHLRVEYDEDARWIILHRGALAVACTIWPMPRCACRSAGEAVLAWAEPQGEDRAP